MIKLYIIFTTLLALLSVSSQSELESENEGEIELVALDENADASNIKACKKKNLLSCTVAVLNFEALSSNQFTLPGGCYGMHKKNNFNGDIHSASYTNDEGCEAYLTYRNSKLFGRIYATAETMFEIEPCSNFPGCHVLKELDPTGEALTSSVDSAQDNSKHELSFDLNALRQQGIDDNTTIVTFTVKWYYTPEVASVTEDLELFFENAITVTNEGFINSDIPIRIETHCIEQSTLTEASNYADGEVFLRAFTDSKGTPTELRGGADMAALMVTDFPNAPNLGGIAWTDSWRYGWTTSVNRIDQVQYYVLGHEFGHNFGCLHNREIVNPDRNKYGYEYGYFISGTNGCTIMAYQTQQYPFKFNMYSTPRSYVTVNGIQYPVGTETENNARVIKENRFAMASMGDEAVQCADTTTNPPVTTEAPVTPTNPPVTTEAPVTPTIPPVTTEAPVTPTIPPVTTEAPVTPTIPPVTTTEAPVTPTIPPVTTTEAPVTPTIPPVTTTEAPVTPTIPPVTTTEAPVTPTIPPVTTTEAPVTPTNPPVTTEAPVTPTIPPITTTEAPGLKTKCRVAGYAYKGKMINNKKAKNAGKCAWRCKKIKNCNAWRYVLNKDSAPKKQRKKCALLRDVSRIDKAEPFIVSGDPSKCKKITLG